MNGTRVVSVVAVLAMACMASAATVWNPAANNIFPPDVGNWNDPLNWTNGVPGDLDFKAVFNVADAAECQVTDAQIIDFPLAQNKWVQGDNGPGGVIRVMDGGSLSQPGGDWAAVGYNSSAHLIVEEGGLVEFNNHMWVAFRPGTGFFEEDRPIVDINGGTVTVGAMFAIGWEPDEFMLDPNGIGYVNVNDGGRLELSNIFNQSNPGDPEYVKSISADSLLNISGTGVVTLPGDFVNVVGAYIDGGRMVANSGADELDVSYDIDADLTTLKVQVPFAADFNGDGVVNGDDFLIWQGTYEGPGGPTEGDANGDNYVDGNDFLIWQQEFAPANGSGSTVPEPAALMLVILGGLVTMCRFRVRV